ncbi:hypothetical protein D3C87_1855760 [compost metagenome]
MVLDQLGHAQGRGHFPRNGRGVDHALGQGLGHLRHRHAHRLGAELGQHAGNDARPAAHLHPLEIFKAGDGVLGVEQARTMGMQGDDVNAGEFVGRICHDIVVEGRR